MGDMVDLDQAAARDPDFPVNDPFDARVYVFIDRQGQVKIKIKPPRIRAAVVRGRIRFARRRTIRARRFRRSASRCSRRSQDPPDGDGISRPARRFRAIWQGGLFLVSYSDGCVFASASAQRQNSAPAPRRKSPTRFQSKHVKRLPIVGTAGFRMPERRRSDGKSRVH
jgi:hypothetical protein